MDKALYLHLGMSKTGTSAIQKFLYQNRNRFYRDTQVHYPDTGLWKDFSHHEIVFSVLENNTALSSELTNSFGRGRLEQQIEAFRTECATKPKVLLSSELLFKSYQMPNFKILFDFLADYFSSIKAIVYLKRQDLWVESRYKHSIISGNEIPLAQLPREKYCDYKTPLNAWGALLGTENVIVRVAEKEQLVDGDLYTDFLAIFDCVMSDRYEKPVGSVNASLERDEMELKRVLNHLNLDPKNFQTLNMLLIEQSSADSTKGIFSELFTLDQRKELLKRYEKLNQSIASEYLPAKKGPLFRGKLMADFVEYPGLSERFVENTFRHVKRQAPALYSAICQALENGTTDASGPTSDYYSLIGRSVKKIGTVTSL
ncbi:MAG: hypothetical protein OSA45_16230 [Halioglobus sp.]|nr:hypothetical protein [Halioglobus sp.]